jgi:16S rRNA (adenine1518-N6/adenine1519-N6)-dimethyltransferase
LERPFPKKRLGQNFLVDPRVVDRIISAIGPRRDETIFEIGPGHGALTGRLVEQAGRVIAIEFDRELIAPLRERFQSVGNCQLLEADALEVDFCQMLAAHSPPAAPTIARVVANLPYNIATAVLERLIEQRRCLSEMVLMLQREVAGRINARAGSTERGFLSVLVQAYCVAEKLFDVSPGAFRPVPKVWSTVVRLRIRRTMPVPVKDETLLWRIVSAGFAQRRKTILNNLRRAPGDLRELIKQRGGESIALCEAGIPSQRRAETLTFDEWAGLANLLAP